MCALAPPRHTTEPGTTPHIDHDTKDHKHHLWSWVRIGWVLHDCTLHALFNETALVKIEKPKRDVVA